MYLDVACLNDVLALGVAGFVGGVVMPWAFRLIGLVFDVVRKILKG